MTKELDKLIENLKWPSNDDYLAFLEKALEDYHKMIKEGVFVPRGNRIAIIIVNRDNNSLDI